MTAKRTSRSKRQSRAEQPATAERMPVSPLEGAAVTLVAALILCLGAMLIAGPEERLGFLLYDDAYYYLGVAQHLAAGHGSTFDGFHSTNGYHPLWCLLLVPLAAWADSPGGLLRLTAALWFMLAAAAPVLLWWVLRHRSGAAAGVAAAALFGLQPFVALGLARPNGLETPLVASLLAAFLGLYEKTASLSWGSAAGPPDGVEVGWLRRLTVAWPHWMRFAALWVGPGLLLGAVILARFDAGMLALAAAGLLGWQVLKPFLRGTPGHQAAASSPLAALAGLTLGAVLVAGPALIWNQVKFGHPMPVSGRVVSLSGEAVRHDLGGVFSAANIKRRAGESAERLPLRAARMALGENALGRAAFGSGRGGAMLMLAVLSVLVLLALRHRARSGPLNGDALALLALYAVMHYAVYAAWLWTGGEARYRIYYFMPQFMLAAAALGTVFGPWLAARLRRERARTMATAGVLFILSWHLAAGVSETWRRYQAQPGPLDQRYVYGWVKQALPADAVLGARDAGKLGYFSGRPVVNLDGLSNSAEYLEALRSGMVAEFIAASPIDYLLFDRPWVGAFDPVRPWVTAAPGTAPGAPRPSEAAGTSAAAAPAGGNRPAEEALPQTLSRLALRPEISLREVTGAPDDWVVYRIDRR